MLAKITLEKIDQKIAPTKIGQKNLAVIFQKIILDWKIQSISINWIGFWYETIPFKMDWIWIIFIYLDFFAQSYLYHYKKKIKISVGQKPIVCIKIDTNYYFCVSQATALKLSQMCLCPSKEVVAY